MKSLAKLWQITILLELMKKLKGTAADWKFLSSVKYLINNSLNWWILYIVLTAENKKTYIEERMLLVS